MGRIAGWFARVEPRRRVRAFVLGLLAELPRKNCWSIGEHAGQASPHGMQHMLARGSWDADGVRDEVRGFVVEHLGAWEAILVDETGDLKKGTASVGVQRQYTGTAGRVENSQVAVFLGYATTSGHALVDCELLARILDRGSCPLRERWGPSRDRLSHQAATGARGDRGLKRRGFSGSSIITPRGSIHREAVVTGWLVVGQSGVVWSWLG